VRMVILIKWNDFCRSSSYDYVCSESNLGVQSFEFSYNIMKLLLLYNVDSNKLIIISISIVCILVC